MNRERLIEEFAMILRADKKSEATVECYSRWVSDFLGQGDKSLKSFALGDIQEYKARLAMTNSAMSIKVKLCAIKAFLESHDNYCCDRVKSPRATRTDPVPLTEQEMQRLQDAARSDPEAYAIILTFYYTGMRSSSLTKLTFDDILWDEGQVVLREAKRGKTYAVLMPKQAMDAINEYAKYREEPTYTSDQKVVFINPRTRMPHNHGTLQNLVKKYAVKARIAKRVYPHLLRHTHGTIARMNGVPLDAIARQLGHESIATTQLYARLADDTYKLDYQAMFYPTKHGINPPRRRSVDIVGQRDIAYG